VALVSLLAPHAEVLLMPEAVIVTFEHKSYTFDGRRWHGTEV
jgi:hypothetical protein